MEYKLDQLVKISCETEVRINNKWVPARPKQPTGFYGIKLRIVGALKVLMGKADAVVWPGGQ